MLFEKLYKIGHKAHTKKIPLIPFLMSRMIRFIYSCELPCSAEIADSCMFMHNGLGVVVHGNTKIGDRTRIYQNVTIGGRNGRPSYPTIGRDVIIGAGACILGDIKIGDNSTIGANAVVLDDVPDLSIVAGIPARVIKTLQSNYNEY